jgi:pSer/pThr/pTyr-binding forkhead associated (FHA) protein
MDFKESKPQTEVPQAQENTSATIVVPRNQKKLLLCHPEGWNLEIVDGDILGRADGNHAERLGKFPVISGNHAKIIFENGEWVITDQKSTNKTYVGSTQSQPGVPVAIKNNDVIQLANVKFIVRES